jgi:AcrR family transcriptional regulator
MHSESKPRGRSDVQEALIEAATRLFSERGPAAVGVREIAQSAGVNHGLVHRHFGSKTGLLKAVVNTLAEEIVSQVGENDEEEALHVLLGGVLGAASRKGAWLRILAWSILDGFEVDGLQDRFPLAERMVEAARREDLGPLDPEARVTLIMSIGLGMLLFAPFLRKATGQDEAQWERTRRQIMSVAMRPGSTES